MKSLLPVLTVLLLFAPFAMNAQNDLSYVQLKNQLKSLRGALQTEGAGVEEAKKMYRKAGRLKRKLLEIENVPGNKEKIADIGRRSKALADRAAQMFARLANESTGAAKEIFRRGAGKCFVVAGKILQIFGF